MKRNRIGAMVRCQGRGMQDSYGVSEDCAVGENHNRRLLGVWSRDFCKFATALFPSRQYIQDVEWGIK
jgi:hypothetical protein